MAKKNTQPFSGCDNGWQSRGEYGFVNESGLAGAHNIVAKRPSGKQRAFFIFDILDRAGLRKEVPAREDLWQGLSKEEKFIR